MILSVEISMYPLQGGYIELIENFLDDLNASHKANHSSVEIRTSNMSTRLYGPFDEVTTLLNQSMRNSMKQHGKMVFTCKYLEGDARAIDSFERVTVK